jgi:hypothetical protein
MSKAKKLRKQKSDTYKISVLSSNELNLSAPGAKDQRISSPDGELNRFPGEISKNNSIVTFRDEY